MIGEIWLFFFVGDSRGLACVGGWLFVGSLGCVFFLVLGGFVSVVGVSIGLCFGAFVREFFFVRFWGLGSFFFVFCLFLGGLGFGCGFYVVWRFCLGCSCVVFVGSGLRDVIGWAGFVIADCLCRLVLLVVFVVGFFVACVCGDWLAGCFG